MPSYHLYVDDRIFGPFSESELVTGFQTRRLPPETPACDESQVWRRLIDYVPGLFFPAAEPVARPVMPAAPELPVAAASANDPMFAGQPPMIATGAIPPLKKKENSPPIAFRKEYEGMGRLSFFGWTALSSAIGILLAQAFPSAPVGAVVMLAMGLYFTARRLINIGWHPAWCMVNFVPCLNAFLGLAVLACPPGYAESHKLDKAGMIIVVLFVAIPLAGLMLAFMLPGIAPHAMRQ